MMGSETRNEAKERTEPSAEELVALLRAAAEPRGRATLSESIALGIEGAILRGQLRDGQRIPPEPELGEALRVSRSVVRDAVRMLVARGLVDVRQGAGTVVTSPSDEAFSSALLALLMRSDSTMGDIVQARAALETQLAPIAVRNGTAEDWTQMEAELDTFEKAIAADDLNGAAQAHVAFHESMYTAMHLPALELVLRPMQACILLTSPPLPRDVLDDWVGSHRPILDALRARDEEGVQQAVATHFKDLDDPRFSEFMQSPFQKVAVPERLSAADVLGLR